MSCPQRGPYCFCPCLVQARTPASASPLPSCPRLKAALPNSHLFSSARSSPPRGRPRGSGKGLHLHSSPVPGAHLPGAGLGGLARACISILLQQGRFLEGPTCQNNHKSGYRKSRKEVVNTGRQAGTWQAGADVRAGPEVTAVSQDSVIVLHHGGPRPPRQGHPTASILGEAGREVCHLL